MTIRARVRAVSSLLLAIIMFATPAFTFAAGAGGGGGGGGGGGPIVSTGSVIAADQTITLVPGWNVVSTPRVLSSFPFSTTTTSANFDIVLLNASSTSGWSTMADLGQTTFVPLYGYFINNKTGANQALNFWYAKDLSPAQRIFERTFPKAGWYSIGVANGTYALLSNAATSTDTNNATHLLNSLQTGPAGNLDQVIDFSYGSSSADITSVAVTRNWKSATAADLDSLNDLRNTKGYAVYLKGASVYSGFQNETPAVTDPTGSGLGTDGSYIHVTVPNGGERWNAGVLNTITWSPYSYDPDVNPSADVFAYLDRKLSNGSFEEVGDIMSNGKASIHTILNLSRNDTLAEPGEYYVRIVNLKTGAWDRSDAPFTVLAKPIDLKVNDSDGPLSLSGEQSVSITWNSTDTRNCYVFTPSGLGGSYDAVTPSGSKRVTVDGTYNYKHVSLQCEYIPSGETIYDWVQINTDPAAALIQVTSPSDGAVLVSNSSMITWNSSAVDGMSIALYKDNKWFAWIEKEVPTNIVYSGQFNWNPSLYTASSTQELIDAGAVFKIYITARKADGTGYVDDKSDIPFRFTSKDQQTLMDLQLQVQVKLLLLQILDLQGPVANNESERQQLQQDINALVVQIAELQSPIPAVSVFSVAQPADSLAPEGATRVPFTSFTLTNDSARPVTINGITVQRTGSASDAAIADVTLIDEDGMQVGSAETLDSGHQAAIGGTFEIPAGVTKTFTVAADIASGANQGGTAAGISVVGIATDANVYGPLPVTGAQQTISSVLSIGSVAANISALDPNAAQVNYIGDTNVRFAGVRFTAGSTEDVKLYSVRFRQSGNVSPSELANVTVNAGGTAYPAMWSADGRYVTAVFPGGILIEKGFSKDVYIQGDIVASTVVGKTLQFDIEKLSDVYFVGQLYGYGIAPTSSFGACISNSATSICPSIRPWFDGSLFHLSGVSVSSISNAVEVVPQNVAVNVPNQVLGGFATDIVGESIQVSSMVFHVSTSSTDAGVPTNVTLVDQNGAVVAGPVDASLDGTLTFTDAVTFGSGRSVYTIKGRLPSSFMNEGTVVLSTNPSIDWTGVIGASSGSLVSLAGGLFSMSTVTIRRASLAASIGNEPTVQSQVPGAVDVWMLRYVLDATVSGEDVRISSLPVVFGNPSNLSSCRVFDGSSILTTGPNVIEDPSVRTGFELDEVVFSDDALQHNMNFSFDSALTIARGTAKHLDIKCNIRSGAAGKSYIGSHLPFGGTGTQSSLPVIVSGDPAKGPEVSIVAGLVAITTDESSPSLTSASQGQERVVIGVWKIQAQNESAIINKIGLALTSESVGDLSSAYVYSGLMLVGTGAFEGNTAQVTLSSPVTVQKDSPVLLTINADIASGGVSQIGDTVKIDWDTAPESNQFVGATSGNYINALGSTAVSGVQIVGNN